MAKNTMTICKSCGAQIATSAKTCPNCGAKNKKPLFKRPWFIILVIIVVLGIIGGAMSGGDDPSAPADDQSADQVLQDESKDEGDVKEEKIEYESVTADQMMDALDSNAAAAKDTYDGKYVAVSGKLGTIDSDGAYIDVMPDDEYAFLGVTCYIQNDDQLEQVKSLNAGDSLTVKGKVTDVGEVLGYYLDIDSIE